MNFIKMNVGEDINTFDLMKIEAQAVTRGIADDDSGVILYGEHAGYKVTFVAEIMMPVYLSGGTVGDALEDSDMALSIIVEDPEGNVKKYFPGVSNGAAHWVPES